MNHNTKRDIDAVVAGYLGIDLTPGFSPSRAKCPLSVLLRPGSLIQTQGLTLSLGGAVANTGLALKRFGRRVALAGLVGRDTLGDIVIRQLRGHGIRSGVSRTDRAGTAYGIVLALPGADRLFLEDPGCNGIFTSRDIDYDNVARCRLFHFGYPTLMKSLFANAGRELKRIITRAKQTGAATSLDMTLPDPGSAAGKANWPAILAAALPHVDIFLPSIEELLAMLEPAIYKRLQRKAGTGDIIDVIPREAYRRLADRILALGVKVLMIKAGHRGAYLRTGDLTALNATTPLRLPTADWTHRELWASPRPLSRSRFRNACGAGDCAVAGFLAAILGGETLDRTGRLAMIAGRDNLYGTDALEGLRPWNRMLREIRRSHR